MKLFKRKPKIYMQFQASNKMILGFDTLHLFGIHISFGRSICILTKDKGWLPLEEIMHRLFTISAIRHSTPLFHIDEEIKVDPLDYINIIIEVFPKFIEVCKAIDDYKTHLFNVSFRNPMYECSKENMDENKNDFFKSMKQEHPKLIDRIISYIQAVFSLIKNWNTEISKVVDLTMFNELLKYDLDDDYIADGNIFMYNNYELIVDKMSTMCFQSYSCLNKIIGNGKFNFNKQKDIDKYNTVIDLREKIHKYFEELRELYGKDKMSLDIVKMLSKENLTKFNKMYTRVNKWTLNIYKSYLKNRYSFADDGFILEVDRRLNERFKEVKIA